MADCDCAAGPYVRGYNPVWSFVDLAGLQADDTFYMWVLENDIPYIPATVYKKPNSTPWTQPIQFLANGTLPIDIFWDDNKTYRLEIRQNIGPLPPSQADPLIYLVANYRPGEGGGIEPGELTNTFTSNQITNPQFSLINFGSPFVLTGATNPDSIEIAPGWFLDLTGTGNLTVEQVPLASNAANPTNAPYALRILLSGAWTGNPVLRQRFNQNGMLWADKYVSTSITARIEGSPQNIIARIDDSEGTQLAVLTTATLSNQFTQYSGVALLPPTTNPDIPPDAYIDYKILLPTAADIYITSVQLISSGVEVNYQYEQDSIERQVDHTFHYYKPQLEYKPIPSYLVGWDFPVNPAQFGEFIDDPLTDSNSSFYCWDQTIVFQKSSEGFTFSRGDNGCFRITGEVANSQVAVIQYVETNKAREILTGPMAVHIVGKTTKVGGISGTVSIYYTDSSVLPDMVLADSIIATIDMDGKPATVNGDWEEVPRGTGNATFEIESNVSQYTNISLNGWEIEDIADSQTARYIAIVVGFETFGSGDEIDLLSISLCAGDIATPPAPQTYGQVLEECQRYYEKSYAPDVNPETDDPADRATTINIITKTQNGSGPPGGIGPYPYYLRNAAFSVEYKVIKFIPGTIGSSPPTVTLFDEDGDVDTVTGYVWVAGITGGVPVGTTQTVGSFWGNEIGDKTANYKPINMTTAQATSIEASTYASGWVNFHYVVDARLGII